MNVHRMQTQRPKVSPWVYFPGSDSLQNWVAQIRQLLATSNRNFDDWALAGTAIVIEVPDAHDTSLLLEAMCADLGFGYEVWIPGVREVPEWPKNGIGAPRLFYVPSGEWQQCHDLPEFHAVAGQVLSNVGHFDPESPEIVVTTVTSYAEIAPTLLGPGRFSRVIRVNAPTAEQFGQMFVRELGTTALSDELRSNPRRVGRLMHETASSVTALRMSALSIRRTLTDAGRPVEWSDLIEMYLQGPIEGAVAVANSNRDRESVAWHEAGHALVAYLDSDGTNIPELVSINPTTSYLGVMVGSIEYNAFANERMRYSDFRHRIRVSLAGRAAEELAYGPEGISAGCESDLEFASRKANLAFSKWGFSLEMEKAGSSSGNLLTVLDEPSDSAARHIETQCRTFLEQQYRYVMDLLILHHDSLLSIKDALMAEAVLDSNAFLNNARVQRHAA